jgi:hypothetical protein
VDDEVYVFATSRPRFLFRIDMGRDGKVAKVSEVGVWWW